MYDFETGRLVAPDGCRMAHIACLSLTPSVFEDNVRRLKYLHGQGMGPILADGLEEAGEEGGTDDLKFERFWVTNLDGRFVVVFEVEPFKVFLV